MNPLMNFSVSSMRPGFTPAGTQRRQPPLQKPLFAGKPANEKKRAVAEAEIQRAVQEKKPQWLVEMLFDRVLNPSALFEYRAEAEGIDKLAYRPIPQLYEKAVNALISLINNPDLPERDLKKAHFTLQHYHLNGEPYPEVRTAHRRITQALNAQLQAADLKQRVQRLYSLTGRIERIQQGPLTETIVKSDDAYSQWTEKRTIPQGQHQSEQRSLTRLLYQEPRLPQAAIRSAYQRLQKSLGKDMLAILKEAFEQALKPKRDI